MLVFTLFLIVETALNTTNACVVTEKSSNFAIGKDKKKYMYDYIRTSIRARAKLWNRIVITTTSSCNRDAFVR